MSDAATLADRITRVKTAFGVKPPESLLRVLAIYADMAGKHPLAELERAIEAAARNAKALLAGGDGPRFPRHALELREPPAGRREEAA